MTDKRPDGRESIELHPEHRSRVRISAHNNAVALAISLAVGVLFVIMIARLGSGSFAAAGILAALVLLYLGRRGTAHLRTGLSRNAWLTARVKADLMTKLGVRHVKVDTSNGVVTLRGSVPFPRFRDVAAELARRQGATRVVNELKVVSLAHGESDAGNSPGE
jgi:hypothetical protein